MNNELIKEIEEKLHKYRDIENDESWLMSRLPRSEAISLLVKCKKALFSFAADVVTPLNELVKEATEVLEFLDSEYVEHEMPLNYPNPDSLNITINKAKAAIAAINHKDKEGVK